MYIAAARQLEGANSKLMKEKIFIKRLGQLNIIKAHTAKLFYLNKTNDDNFSALSKRTLTERSLRNGGKRMLEELKQETNYTLTENGALTYASTMDSCLDLFSGIGALRHASAEAIVKRFQRAYLENPDLAMKCLFFARDVRGGLGERRTFRILLEWLASNNKASVEKNLPFIAEYGRYDDLLVLLDTPCRKAALNTIKEQLDKDLEYLKAGKPEDISLLAKWLPSINASNRETIAKARLIANFLMLDNKAYRKLLTVLREKIKLIENNLRTNDYSFDYSKQPSKAMLKYRKAFLRNDAERYKEFLGRVACGKAKLHTGTLTPYDIVAPVINSRFVDIGADERESLNTAWNALEDFSGDENALVVVDGSGSMYCWDSPTPAAVAESLAIYFAERNTGHFKNHFITFSTKPKLVEIQGKDIVDKIRYCMSYNEYANTNVSKVFKLILNTAVKHKLPPQELPSTIYIISDMEFDCCAEGAAMTNFAYAKKLFQNAGYELPRLVFWNVASRNSQVPVTKNEQGVALVSGCSPQVFSMIKEGSLNPLSFMLEVLNSERYAVIAA